MVPASKSLLTRTWQIQGASLLPLRRRIRAGLDSSESHRGCRQRRPTSQVTAALDKMNIMTFYGAVKFSTDAKTHGKQTTHDMVYMQWQKDAAGKLVTNIVWPSTPSRRTRSSRNSRQFPGRPVR